MYNTEVSLKYKEIDHSDIQNMAYLKAKLKHAVSGEDISCGWFFIILAEKYNFRVTSNYFEFQFLWNPKQAIYFIILRETAMIKISNTYYRSTTSSKFL